MKKLLFILLIAHCSLLIAQTPTQEWVARYIRPAPTDGLPVYIALDKVGDVYITGTVQGSSNQDVITIKYNSSGIQQWAQPYNGPLNAFDMPDGIVADSIGNVYVTLESGPAFGPFDIITLKYDPAGILQWAKVFAGPGNSSDAPGAIGLKNSSLYVTGGSEQKTVLIKYNTITGDSIWVKKFVTGSTSGISRMAMDNSTGIYLGGGSTAINIDYLIVKYDTNGSFQWYNVFNGSGNQDDFVEGIAVDNSHNVIITGFSRTNGLENYLTVKYTPTGSFVWAKYYGFSSSDYAVGLVTDNNGNIYVTGSSALAGTGSDFATIKYNTNGDSLWVRRYNGPASQDDDPCSIIIDTSANIYVTGRSIAAGTSWDYATIKYNSNGTLLWLVRYNNIIVNSEDLPNASIIDDNNNIYVTGLSDRGSFNLDFATVKYNQTVGIYNGYSNNSVKNYQLFEAYPNPLNPTTNIKFEIPEDTFIKLDIFNSLGIMIESLLNSELKRGKYSIIWNAQKFSSGIYFCRLLTAKFNKTNKLILIK
jgi:hypothetical protein